MKTYHAISQDDITVLIVIHETVGSLHVKVSAGFSAFSKWMDNDHRTVNPRILTKEESESLSEICDIPMIGLIYFDKWLEARKI